MEKRSVLLIDPEPAYLESEDLEDMLVRCLEFMCGLEVQSIVRNDEQYKVYLNSTSYDKSSVETQLTGTDYISGCSIIV